MNILAQRGLMISSCTRAFMRCLKSQRPKVYDKLNCMHFTIGSCARVRLLRYETRGKIGEHETCLRVSRVVIDSNSSLVSALKFPRCFM